MKGQFTKLFLIGNGFDRWQGLPTSYDNFRQYYSEHIIEIAKELGIKIENDKTGNIITPVEKIFGDIFNPEALPGEFFWNFESSMALLDEQNIALYFGKSNKDVYQMQETLDEAMEIFRMRNQLYLVILSIQKLHFLSLWNKSMFIELAEVKAKG